MNKLDRLNRPKRDLSHPNIRPKDAASLVVIDRAGGTLRILLGRRHANQEFIPDKYVFPGGRMEPADRKCKPAAPLTDRDVERLLSGMKGKPNASRAQALAMAAIRETFEETGLLIGAPQTAEETRPKTLPDGWKPFFENGIVPRLDVLHFVARAITPPGRVRRFDTRFFCVDASHVQGRVGKGDGEFTALHWLTVDEVETLDIHPMTRTVIDDVVERLAPSGEPRPELPVPSYVFRNGAFRRELIA